MFKKLILLIFLLSFTVNTYAHPLDISNSTIGIKNNKVNITTYFHSFEVDYLLKINWIKNNSIEEYFENKEIIEKYITNNISLKNNQEYCKIRDFEFFKEEIYNIVTDWFKISYKIECKNRINNFNLEINYFTNFPLQTNKVKIYNLNKWIDLMLYKVLTPKINHIEIKDLDKFKAQKKIDSDCDWLWNEDEKIYKTDPYKIDTDWDNYSDFEEVTDWQNPLNKEYWPWQEYRGKLLPIKCNEKQIQINKTANKETELKKYNNLDSNSYWSEYLKKILIYISNYINKNEWNLFYIFIIVYILWIIHAIWPWHSKSLLVAYTIEKENWYKKGLIYALIFSITHILDILILFWITTLAFQYIDVAKYNYYIQVVSISTLFIFSIYLVYKAFFNKINCKKKEKKTLMIAFLSGLAPCSFAWSIYFLLLSLGKLSFILPLIIALWLWILSTLIMIVIITVFIKEKSLSKTKTFSKYSSKISALIILSISLFLLFKTLSI